MDADNADASNASVHWVDLVDPDSSAIVAAWDGPIDDETLALLSAPAVHDDLPRPRFRTGKDSVAAVFLLPLLSDSGTDVVHQEIDLLLSATKVLTVRKTPRSTDGSKSDWPPYDPADLAELGGHGTSIAAGELARVIVDDVAEAFLDLTDELVDRIDDLEDRVETGELTDVQREISRFRRDLLHLRRLVTPTRDAVRRVVDGRVEIESGALFPRQIEVEFGDVYDKLLRAGDALESARELIGGVRDYVQTRIANDQNEVMKRLTVSASLLLLPTFIVGLYGQNFIDIPELKWRFGYLYSWGLIIVTTVAQLVWFRRKRWI